MFSEVRRLFGHAVHMVGDRTAFARAIAPPLRTIAGHDAMGGHTTARHIAKTARDLRMRLAAEPTRLLVGCFWDEPIARACINYAVSEHLGDILRWLPDPTQPNKLVLTSSPTVRTWVGLGLRRSDMKLLFLKKVKVVLIRVTPTDFYVLTAYPD